MVTVTVHKSRTYIVQNGVVTELDPKRKYTIENGRLKEIQDTIENDWVDVEN